MSQVEFEPFGESIAETSFERPAALQRAMLRTGVGVFWTLVAGIVIARAIYFDPDFAANFVQVAKAAFHTIFSA